MKFIIGSDLVPTESNIKEFKEGNIKKLLGSDLYNIWNSADFRIFNLEVPLSDKEDMISKCGPNLIAPTSTIKGIKQLRPSLITLANNHILDQGSSGLESTQKLLVEHDIPFIGVGKNLKEASKPYIILHEGKSIGIYTCAENEFTIATQNSPGANPYNPLETFDHIEELKNNCDYLIVLYHGGKEHYRYPSPHLQKVCRKMVEKGADVVICQHSHCIGAFEKYKNSTIVYGQGNFIFDYSNNSHWNTSLLIKIEIDNGIGIEYVPLIRAGNGIKLAEGTSGQRIIEDFNKRSKEILNEDFLNNEYNKFANESLEMYLRNFSGTGKWLSRLDRKLLNNFFIKKKYNKRQLLALQNFIECEAHRELLITGVKNNTK